MFSLAPGAGLWQRSCACLAYRDPTPCRAEGEGSLTPWAAAGKLLPRALSVVSWACPLWSSWVGESCVEQEIVLGSGLA